LLGAMRGCRRIDHHPANRIRLASGARVSVVMVPRTAEGCSAIVIRCVSLHGAGRRAAVPGIGLGAFQRLGAPAKIGQAAVEVQSIDQFGDLGAAAAGLNRFRDASLEMVLHQYAVHAFEGGLCCGDLFHQLETIGFGLDHPDHAV
jgi:hypothetical protein